MICEYRDSQNNLKPFTSVGFPQSKLEKDTLEGKDQSLEALRLPY